MPSRSLSYAKIMQSECRTTSLLDCYAEVKLILCKDTSKQSQRQKITFKYEDYNDSSFVTAVNNWAWLCQNSHVLHKIKVTIKFNR